MAERPNILWICTDQQRFDTLGCYGNRYVHTPNIDRLAAEGVVFLHTYAQNPVCTPSRAAFLTGRYPRTTRCRQNGQNIPRDELLITRILADAGYDCGLIGKLHISSCEPRACGTMEPRIDDGYSEFHWSHHPTPSWAANEYAQWLLERGVSFDEVKGGNHPECKYVQIGIPKEYHQTTWCAERAITFIRARAEDNRPWLLSINPFDPHHPFDPPAEYLSRYNIDEIPLPAYREGELENKPIFQQIDHRGAYDRPGYMAFDEMSERDHRLVRAAYYAMIDLIDEQVGRIIQALEETGQRDNTIIIFMSDHGEMLGDHGIYLKGPYLYDGAVRVPLIISYPKRFVKGVRSEALVELFDIAPTILEAVGIERPAGMQARSLMPILVGETDPHTHRDSVYCEYYNAWKHKEAFATMVRTRTHKLVLFHGTEPSELYDLEKDPCEHDNLWDDPSATKLKMEMLKLASDRMAFTVDPLPERVGIW